MGYLNGYSTDSTYLNAAEHTSEASLDSSVVSFQPPAIQLNAGDRGSRNQVQNNNISTESNGNEDSQVELQDAVEGTRQGPFLYANPVKLKSSIESNGEAEAPVQQRVDSNQEEESGHKKLFPDNIGEKLYAQDVQLLEIEMNNEQNSDENPQSSVNSDPTQQHKSVLQRQKSPQVSSLLSSNNQAPIQRQENRTGLPDEVKDKMESTLNADFSNVNIQTNSDSATKAGALAYTQGNNVHFAPGQFKPDTRSGQELIGHELTHVVQQRESSVPATTSVGGMPVNDDPGLEMEADRMGSKAASADIDSAQLKINPSKSVGKSIPVQQLKVATHSSEVYSGSNYILSSSQGERAPDVTDAEHSTNSSSIMDILSHTIQKKDGIRAGPANSRGPPHQLSVHDPGPIICGEGAVQTKTQEEFQASDIESNQPDTGLDINAPIETDTTQLQTDSGVSDQSIPDRSSTTQNTPVNAFNPTQTLQAVQLKCASEFEQDNLEIETRMSTKSYCEDGESPPSDNNDPAAETSQLKRRDCQTKLIQRNCISNQQNLNQSKAQSFNDFRSSSTINGKGIDTSSPQGPIQLQEGEANCGNQGNTPDDAKVTSGTTTFNPTNAEPDKYSGKYRDVLNELAGPEEDGSVSTTACYTVQSRKGGKEAHVAVTVNMVKKMPKWMDLPNVIALSEDDDEKYKDYYKKLVDAWTNYYNALDTHEDGHKTVDEEHFKDCHTQLIGLEVSEIWNKLGSIEAASDELHHAYHESHGHAVEMKDVQRPYEVTVDKSDDDEDSVQYKLDQAAIHNSQVVQKKDIIQRECPDGATYSITNERFSGESQLQDIARCEIEQLTSRQNGTAVSAVQNALLALGYTLIRYGEDGKFGDETSQSISQFRSASGLGEGGLDAAALQALDRAAPPPGEQEAHEVDYDRLLEDNKLDITLAIGYDERQNHVHKIEEVRAWLNDRGFRNVDNTSSTNEFYTKQHGFNDRQLGQTRIIDVNIQLILPGNGSAALFVEALNNSDITAYSGHARGGVGPDFDDKSDSTENVVIGRDSEGHESGDFEGPNTHGRHVRTDGVNDLEELTESGGWTPERYRVWLFSACSSINYLDELRGGLLPPGMDRSNLDIFGTRSPVMGSAGIRAQLQFIDGILAMQSIEEIVQGMNETNNDMLADAQLGSRRTREWANPYWAEGQSDNPVQPKLADGKTLSKVPVQRKSSNGNGIPDQIRGQMENSFDADFSDVKIHQNSESASQIGALAYTQGSNIHFAPGQFKMDTESGQELLGHELTHVIQQRKLTVPQTTSAGGMVVNDDPALEREADQMGAKAAQCKLISNPTSVNSGYSITSQSGYKLIQSKVIQKDGDEDACSEAANRLKTELEATFWTNNEEVIRGLRFANTGEKANQLKQKYREISTGGHSLIHALRSEYSEDGNAVLRYKTIGMAYGLGPDNDAIQLGGALNGINTDNGTVQSILYHRNLQARQALKHTYDRVYRNAGISRGLANDLAEELDGWDEQKSVMLLRQDLNKAQNIYGYAKTDHDSQALRLLHEEWNGQEDVGPLRTLEQQWHRHVVAGPSWTRKNMRQYLAQELDDSFGRDAEQTFESARQIESGDTSAAGARLDIAAARAQGAIETWDDDEESAYAAADSAREAIASLPEDASEARRRSALERMERATDGQLNSLEQQQYEHRLRASLTKADELYYKIEDEDWPGCLSIIDGEWAHGRINQLNQNARENVVSNGQTLRARYIPRIRMLRATSDGIGARAMALLGEGSNALRGSRRIFAENLHGGSALERISAFFTLGGRTKAQAAVRLFDTQNTHWLTSHGVRPGVRTNDEGETEPIPVSEMITRSPYHVFCTALVNAYEENSHYWSIFNLLVPVSGTGRRAARERAQRARAERDVMGPDVADLLTPITGEDPSARVDADIRNLERTGGLREESDEQATGRATDRLGSTQEGAVGLSPQDAERLSTAEMGDFTRDAATLRQANQTVTEMTAAVVQLAVSAILTILTGGAAAQTLVSSIAIAVTAAASAMATREVMLQREYRLVSQENLQSLISEAATAGAAHGATAVVRSAQSAAATARAMEAGLSASATQRAIQVAVREGQLAQTAARSFASGVTSEGMSLAFSNRGITAERLGNSALTVVTNTGAATLGSGINNRITQGSESVTRALAGNVADELTQAVIQRGREAPGARLNGVGDYVNHFGPEMGRAMGRAFASTVQERVEQRMHESFEHPTPTEESDEVDGSSMDRESQEDGNRSPILPPAPSDEIRVPGDPGEGADVESGETVDPLRDTDPDPLRDTDIDPLRDTDVDPLRDTDPAPEPTDSDRDTTPIPEPADSDRDTEPSPEPTDSDTGTIPSPEPEDSDRRTDPDIEVDSPTGETVTSSGDIVEGGGTLDTDDSSDDRFVQREFYDADAVPGTEIHNARYSADAELSPDGTLSFDLNLRADGRRSGHISGSRFYRAAIAHFTLRNRRIRRIRSNYTGDNLAEYVRLRDDYIARGMGASQARHLAASRTWTGRTATNSGFGRITSVEEGSHGPVIIFEPGPSNAPPEPPVHTRPIISVGEPDTDLDTPAGSDTDRTILPSDETDPSSPPEMDTDADTHDTDRDDAETDTTGRDTIPSGTTSTPHDLNGEMTHLGPLPDSATIVQRTSNYVIYDTPQGQRIRFRARSAVTLQEATPGRNMTTDSLAGLNDSGLPYVIEGRHRAIGSSQGGIIDPSNGGIPGHPGVLDYNYTQRRQRGGVPVRDLTIDPHDDVPRDEADRQWEQRYGSGAPISVDTNQGHADPGTTDVNSTDADSTDIDSTDRDVTDVDDTDQDDTNPIQGKFQIAENTSKTQLAPSAQLKTVDAKDKEEDKYNKLARADRYFKEIGHSILLNSSLIESWKNLGELSEFLPIFIDQHTSYLEFKLLLDEQDSLYISIGQGRQYTDEKIIDEYNEIAEIILEKLDKINKIRLERKRATEQAIKDVQNLKSILIYKKFSKSKLLRILQFSYPYRNERDRLFEKETGKDLEETILTNMSVLMGDFTSIMAKAYLEEGKLRPADKFYIAVKGAGTDEGNVYFAMIQAHKQGIDKIEEDYRKHYKHDHEGYSWLPHTGYGVKDWKIAGRLVDDMSGTELDKARCYLSFGQIRPVDKIHIAKRKNSTDGIFEAVREAKDAGVVNINAEYEKSWGRSIQKELNNIRDMKAAMSGNGYYSGNVGAYREAEEKKKEDKALLDDITSGKETKADRWEKLIKARKLKKAYALYASADLDTKSIILSYLDPVMVNGGESEIKLDVFERQKYFDLLELQDSKAYELLRVNNCLSDKHIEAFAKYIASREQLELIQSESKTHPAFYRFIKELKLKVDTHIILFRTPVDNLLLAIKDKNLNWATHIITNHLTQTEKTSFLQRRRFKEMFDRSSAYQKAIWMHREGMSKEAAIEKGSDKNFRAQVIGLLMDDYAVRIKAERKLLNKANSGLGASITNAFSTSGLSAENEQRELEVELDMAEWDDGQIDEQEKQRIRARHRRCTNNSPKF